jgi:hypothetical protein
MTTPIQRLTRLLDEGARFMVELPGQTSIDLTPDVIAAMAQAQTCNAQSAKITITIEANRRSEE